MCLSTNGPCLPHVHHSFAFALDYNTLQRAGHFGKWHLVSEDSLNNLGCTYTSSEYECNYTIIREAVRAAGFDTAEAVYVGELAEG